MKRRDILMRAGALGVASAMPTSVFADRSDFYVPAEDVLHECTFMQWPVSRAVYDDPLFLEDVQDTIAKIANHISEFEPVIMLAAKPYHNAARKRLSSRVTLWDIPTEDLWCRDAGPIFAVNDLGERAISHIQYNGWGNKQTNRYDSQIARKVAERLDIPLLPTGLKGEAGGVEQDGHGLLIAHESSWVTQNRNPNMTRAQIEERLLKAYGANQILWSKGVVNQDITDYHIDSLARFTGPRRVLINLPSTFDPYDPFHRAAEDTHHVLIEAGLDVHVIPEPKLKHQSAEFVASYVNFYVCNGAVITPKFGDEQADQIAYDALSEHYPNREIVMLHTEALGALGGGIHCATQQMPTI